MCRNVRSSVAPLLSCLVAALVALASSGCGGETAKDFKGGLEDSAKVAAEGKAKLKVDRTKAPKGKGMADDDTF